MPLNKANQTRESQQPEDDCTGPPAEAEGHCCKEPVMPQSY